MIDADAMASVNKSSKFRITLIGQLSSSRRTTIRILAAISTAYCFRIRHRQAQWTIAESRAARASDGMK